MSAFSSLSEFWQTMLPFIMLVEIVLEIGLFKMCIRDSAYFGIDRIEHARQVSRDPLDEQPSEPFIEFVEYAAHKRSPPDDQPNRPESRGTRVMPMRATPPPAINCFIPN